ncbi:MAG: hypothetical protein ACXV7J_00960 [Methylomonas sp.]
MKMVRLLAALSVFISASPSFAAQTIERVNGYDVFVDAAFLRPLGLAATVAGTATFVALSPFAAIASIPKPHNAFPKLFAALVNEPAKYTFVRPVEHYYSD